MELAFKYAGLRHEDHVVIDPTLYRPTDVDLLQGDYSKAARRLGWKPSVTFKELVQEMVDADLRAVSSYPSTQSAAMSTLQ